MQSVYTVVRDTASLRAEGAKSGPGQKKLLGLFTKGNMMYEIDRVREAKEARQPSLREVFFILHFS